MDSIDLIKALEETGLLKVKDSPGHVWNIIKAYLGDKAIDFDTEAIESYNSYKVIFNQYKLAFRDDLKLDRRAYTSEVDFENKLATISITLDGETYSSEWKQETDWVSGEFFKFIEEIVEPKLPGKFVHYIPLDQCYRGLYLPNELADKVNSVFREFEKEL
ncbi:hypothetical protein [Microbulbifer sp. JMSA003]|uniref:hypothetical protein n=1 Tax=Microbulbifer sp. JMSA003 TaxID=3243369 RepID=UPI0040393D35